MIAGTVDFVPAFVDMVLWKQACEFLSRIIHTIEISSAGAGRGLKVVIASARALR